LPALYRDLGQAAFLRFLQVDEAGGDAPAFLSSMGSKRPSGEKGCESGPTIGRSGLTRGGNPVSGAAFRTYMNYKVD
jgi:hypothetical protein